MDGGGAVYASRWWSGRALLSVGSPYGAQPATLALTTRGRLARRTAFGPPAVSPPWFADGHALTRTGPAQYTLTRIGEGAGVTLAGAGELWGFGVDGAGRARPDLRHLARAWPLADDRRALPAERRARSVATGAPASR